MNSVGVGLATIMLVSSANNVGLDISDIGFGKSLIYKRKNKGPRTEPCGTPYFTSSHCTVGQIAKKAGQKPDFFWKHTIYLFLNRVRKKQG
jgi:hypothetical protein